MSILLSNLRLVMLSIQVTTFVVLGVVLLAQGAWKLGVAQLLLAVIQALVYL